jgi:hypothetical protein
MIDSVKYIINIIDNNQKWLKSIREKYNEYIIYDVLSVKKSEKYDCYYLTLVYHSKQLNCKKQMQVTVYFPDYIQTYEDL